MLKLNLRRLAMKKIVMASAVMAATALASDFESRPEASVPTPFESRETLNNAPKMSEKENVDWQKMREERRIAREQILKDLRNNTEAEKKELRNDVASPQVRELPKEREVEKPGNNAKNEFVHEKQVEEKDQKKGPLGNPFVGPGRLEPLHPFNPRPIEINPWEKQNPRDWNNGQNPRK